MILDFSQVIPPGNGVVTFPDIVIPTRPTPTEDVRETVMIGGGSSAGTITAIGSIDSP